MTTHEVLVRARARMESQGAQQIGGWFSADSYCSAGVIACETGATRPYSIDFRRDDIPDARRGAIEALARVIPEKLGDALHEITYFNDSHSHAEVLAAFDKAIAATAPAPDMSWLEEPAAEYLVS